MAFSNLTNTPFGVINILQRIITFAAETPHDVSVRLGSVSRIWYETQECYCSEMWQYFAQNLISKTHISLNGLSIIERENSKIENERSGEDDAAVTSTTRKQQQQHIRYTKHIFKMRYAIFVAKFRNKINKDSITFYEREEEVVDANGRSNLFNDIENCGIPDFQFRCPMIAQNLLIPLQKYEFSSTIGKERFEKLKQELEQQQQQQQNANDDDASSVPTLKPYINSHQEENNFPLLYCHVCDKNVYSVTNSKQLSEQARKGRCVYISKDHSKIMSLANRTKEQIEGEGIGIRFTRTNYAVITDEPATENGGAAEEFLRRVAFAFGRESQARSEDYLPTFTHFLSQEVLFVHPLPKEVNGSSASLHCFYIVRIPPLKKCGESSEIDTFLRNHPCHDEFGVLGKSQMPAKGGWSKFVVVNASALRWFLTRENEFPDRVSLTPNLFSSQKQSFVVVRSLMETEGNFFSLGEVEGCQPHKQMHTAMEALISTIVIPLMIPTSLFDPGEIGHIGGIEIEPDVEFDVPPSSDFLTAGGGSDDDDDDVPRMA